MPASTRPAPPRPAPAPLARRGCTLALLAGLTSIASVAQTGPAAETSRDSRSARLGFKFDPAAHAAAQPRPDGTEPGEDPPPPPGVLRLPRHVVVGERIPFEPDELLTPEGRVEVAKKRHLTPLYRVTFGPLSAVLTLLNNPLMGWHPNAPEAMGLYEDAARQRRSQREAELMDLAQLAEQAKKIERAGRSKDRKP